MLLPAAQEYRRTIREIRQADQLERFFDAPLDFLAIGAPHVERERDVFKYRHVRPDRVGLKHHADVASFRRHIDAPIGRNHHAARDLHLAGVGLFEARDHAQSRRLAATARSEQGDDFALLDFERDVIDSG